MPSWGLIPSWGRHHDAGQLLCEFELDHPPPPPSPQPILMKFGMIAVPNKVPREARVSLLVMIIKITIMKIKMMMMMMITISLLFTIIVATIIVMRSSNLIMITTNTTTN